MKRYILIAGVNGAGKSTLYQAIDELKDMERVNTDVFSCFARYKEGRLISVLKNVPQWYKRLEL